MLRNLRIPNGGPPDTVETQLSPARCRQKLRGGGTSLRRALLFSLFLACLASAGCAGLAWSQSDRAQTPRGMQKVYDQQRAELERELTLYSD